MHAAAVCFELHVPESRSLKSKRAAIRPIVDGLRHRFKVSVAEVDHQDTWQRAAIGVALVDGSAAHLQEVLDSVERFVAARRRRRAARHRDELVGPSVTSPRKYPRTARLNESLLEVLAEELERLSDPRLELVTITGVDVTRDLSRAKVYFSTLGAETTDTTGNVADAALAGLRAAAPHLRSVVGKQLRIRQVPALVFEADPGILSGQRIEEILRGDVALESDEIE